jgi:Domain of unknown function (DUF4388)
MFLNGSLENFSVADILQLLSFSKQTGALHVKGETTGVLYLDDGEVYFASKEAGLPLEETVVAAGIPRADWDAAVAASSERNEIGRALTERGVSADLIGYVVHLIVSDTAFELMRMPRDGGSFDFRVGEEHPMGPVHKVRIDDLVSEIRERLAQWEAISEFISSPSDLVTASNELPEDNVELFVSREQWALLVAAIRLDGSSVADLARETGRSDADVASALHPLIDSGLVEVEPRSNGATADPTAPPVAEPLAASDAPAIAEAADLVSDGHEVAGELSEALFDSEVPAPPPQETTWWQEGERAEAAPGNETAVEPPDSVTEPAEGEALWQPIENWGDASDYAPEEPSDEGELQLLEPPPSEPDEWTAGSEPDEWTVRSEADEQGLDTGSQRWFEGAGGSLTGESWDEGEAADPFGDEARALETEEDQQLRPVEGDHPDERLWDLGVGGVESPPPVLPQHPEIPLPPPPEAAGGDVENAALRTLALQELRDLAGTAPVQPARGPRPAGPQKSDEASDDQATSQPKVRALRRIIARVRGL